MDGGLAPSSANKSLIRRLQRKHTAASYRHMKEKLLRIVQPIPTAVLAADLEDFRHHLYYKDAPLAPLATTPEQPCIHQCSWCGIWTPLPTKPQHATTKEPLVQQLEAVDATVDTLLETCLCQTRYELDSMGNSVDTEPILTAAPIWKQVDKDATDIAAELSRCTHRLKRYCFKRTRICEVPGIMHKSVSVQPITPKAPQYYTEESTGECKTQ